MDQKIIRNEVKQSRHRLRRVFTLEQKRGFIEKAKQAGSVSLICRKYGLAPSMLFEWRRRMEEGALSGLNAGEEVVPVSQMRELNNKIWGLERLLGKKTMEIEILKEAVEIGRKKN